MSSAKATAVCTARIWRFDVDIDNNQKTDTLIVRQNEKGRVKVTVQTDNGSPKALFDSQITDKSCALKNVSLDPAKKTLQLDSLGYTDLGKTYRKHKATLPLSLFWSYQTRPEQFNQKDLLSEQFEATTRPMGVSYKDSDADANKVFILNDPEGTLVPIPLASNIFGNILLLDMDYDKLEFFEQLRESNPSVQIRWLEKEEALKALYDKSQGQDISKISAGAKLILMALGLINEKYKFPDPITKKIVTLSFKNGYCPLENPYNRLRDVRMPPHSNTKPNNF